MSHFSFLELTTSRLTSNSQESMLDFLKVLPMLCAPLIGNSTILPAPLSLEIRAHQLGVQLFIRIPSQELQKVQSHFLSCFTHGNVKIHEEDPLELLWQKLPAHPYAVAHLQLKELNDVVDPSGKDLEKALIPLFGALSTICQKADIYIQILLETKLHFFNQLINMISPPKENCRSEESVVTVGIRVFSRASTQLQATTNLQHICESYQHFSRSNRLELTFSHNLFFKHHLLKLMKQRSWLRCPSSVLYYSSLAALFHPPDSGHSHISSLHWSTSLRETVPLKLPKVSRGSADSLVPIGRSGSSDSEHVFGLTTQQRQKHTYIIGKTGSGKSTLLANMIVHDIKRNRGVCVIDPHGDLVDTILDFIPSHRINDVIVCDPSQLHSAQLSLLESSPGSPLELTASQVLSVFKKQYHYSWGPRLEYVLRNCLVTLLLCNKHKLSHIHQLLTDTQFRHQLTKTLQDPFIVRFWCDEFENMSDKQMNETISPILNKVGQFLTSATMRHVLDQSKSSFSLENALNDSRIVLCKLSPGLIGEDNAQMLGSLILSQLQLVSLKRASIPEEERKDFFVYVDEFQKFATETFEQMLAESRKYHVNLTIANQYLDQLPESMRQAVLSNCATTISFAVSPRDASTLKELFLGSFSLEEISSLKQFHGVIKMSLADGSPVQMAFRSLPPLVNKNENREKILKVSSERYQRARKHINN